MLDKLQPKYNPLHNPEADNLSLTPTSLEENQSDFVLLNPSITKGDDLSPQFQSF